MRFVCLFVYPVKVMMNNLIHNEGLFPTVDAQSDDMGSDPKKRTDGLRKRERQRQRDRDLETETETERDRENGLEIEKNRCRSLVNGI